MSTLLESTNFPVCYLKVDFILSKNLQKRLVLVQFQLRNPGKPEAQKSKSPKAQTPENQKNTDARKLEAKKTNNPKVAKV